MFLSQNFVISVFLLVFLVFISIYLFRAAWLISCVNTDYKMLIKIQKNSQFTVSEIIGYLNEFETPPWVFERMFQQSEMYYFKETELVQLETEVSDELVTHYEKSEKFISDLSEAFAEVAE